MKFLNWNTATVTCYDLRLLELTRLLMFKRANLIVIPTAWLREPFKEDHVEALPKARAFRKHALCGDIMSKILMKYSLVEPA